MHLIHHLPSPLLAINLDFSPPKCHTTLSTQLPLPLSLGRITTCREGGNGGCPTYYYLSCCADGWLEQEDKTIKMAGYAGGGRERERQRDQDRECPA